MAMDGVETQHNEGHQNQDHPGAILELGQRKDQHDDGCTESAKAIDNHLQLPARFIVQCGAGVFDLLLGRQMTDAPPTPGHAGL